MNKPIKFVFLLIIIISIIISCEKNTKPDTTPPTVTIISPQDGSIVYQVVSIICMSSDNEGVEKVELWVNGISTGVIDNTEPYSLDWNTTTYEDGSYIIVVRAYDTSGNTTDSDPITLTINNSGSYPTPVELYPITYQDGSFIISWSQCIDDDFSSYKLYESLSEDMSGETLIYESNEVTDASYVVNGISEDERRYYQVTVTDIFNLETSSTVATGSSFFKIVFERGSGDDGDIYIMDEDGINQTKLTYSSYCDSNPIWTPDGDHILFVRIFGIMNCDIFIMNSDESNEINLTNNVGSDQDMKISGDGEKIVFFSYANYPKDIYIMNSDGSGRTNLTNDDSWDGDPDISHDGQKIVWTSRRTGINEIFIMNSDG
ncbi:MAG: PD40 domain-containing protein, partial [Candidatus Cloacimonetes bacterium]|nr:PD40 domain-containing protein [Candidatus Cloacimonadota bacterium]